MYPSLLTHSCQIWSQVLWLSHKSCSTDGGLDGKPHHIQVQLQLWLRSGRGKDKGKRKMKYHHIWPRVPNGTESARFIAKSAFGAWKCSKTTQTTKSYKICRNITIALTECFMLENAANFVENITTKNSELDLCLIILKHQQCLYALWHVTWSASISTVFIVNRRLQKLKRSSSDGPRRSMTSTL